MPATVIFLTTTGAGTWTSPPNLPTGAGAVTVECVAGGAGGNNTGGGGGGAAYSKSLLTLAPNTVYNLSIAAFANSGNGGFDTWFGASSFPASGQACGAKGGALGGVGAGGAGGAAASGYATGAGSIKTSGGAGGSVATDAGGGGGAGGAAGDGVTGSNGSVGGGGNGGAGDAGIGGAGGTGAIAGGGNPGSPGAEWTSTLGATAGSGGGGAGATGGGGGAGGLYGGGGGGGIGGGGGGQGRVGIIVISFTPAFLLNAGEPFPTQFKFNDSNSDNTWEFKPRLNLSLAASFQFPIEYDGRYTAVDDSSGWQQGSIKPSAAAIQGLLTTKFFGAPGQVPTKRWSYDYNVGESFWNQASTDSAILSLLTATRIRGAGGQVSTKLWRYDYDTAESAWNQSGVDSAVIQAFTAQRIAGVGGQGLTKTWHLDYDDSSTRQLGSAAKNLNLASAAIVTPFSKLWRWDSDTGENAFQNQHTYNNNLLSPPTVLQIKSRQWLFGQDDSSSWRFVAPYNVTLAANLQFPAEQEGHYNIPSEDFGWQGQPVPSVLPTHLATKQPFTYYPWKFGQDDSSGWSSNSKGRNPNLVAAVVTKPFSLAPWQFVQDDSSAWIFGAPSTALLNFIATLARSSFVVPRPGDESNWQSGSKGKNLNLISVAATTVPFLAGQWRFGQDDSSGWQFKLPYNFGLVANLQFPPLINGAYSAPDDYQVWSASKARNLNLVSIIEPFINLPWQWKFNHDDASGWQSGSKTRNPNLVTIIEPTINLPWQWKFNHDDSSGWGFVSKARNPNLVTIIEPSINPPWLWKFSHDDTSNWLGKPIASALLVPVLTAKAPGKLWRWDHDVGESFQLILPKGRNPNLVSIVEPFVNPPFRFNYDDSSGWQFNSKASSLLIPIVTAGGQTSAPIWKFVTRPLDDPFWQFKGQLNVNVTNRPIIITPPVSSWSYGSSNPDDAPSWNGIYWRNYTIEIQPTHETDPRFVTNPLALNAVLPSGFGSGRTFITTPKVYGMPYGNDFSTIDPVVESVTATFNFDPWLAIGETIVSVLALTASVAKQSLAQDLNPQLIILGSSQIGPVPPAFQGAAPGIPNRAVLQEIANCQPGVVYLLQCLIFTSNGQKLNLATHLPCSALN